MLHDLNIISLQVKRVPLVLELVPILIGQGVRLLVSLSDDGVRTLPLGSQLSLIRSESRATRLGLRLNIPDTSPFFGVPPGFSVDRSR